jgi:hypothetical protein
MEVDMKSWKQISLLSVCVVILLASTPGKPAWQMKADYVEACSCHLFCPCYFKIRLIGSNANTVFSSAASSIQDHSQHHGVFRDLALIVCPDFRNEIGHGNPSV